MQKTGKSKEFRVISAVLAVLFLAVGTLTALLFATVPKPSEQGSNEIESLSLALSETDAVYNSDAANTRTITAKVRGTDGTYGEDYQAVIWSISENDAVTLTANGMTATLTCNAAFSEQITVTCTSMIDTSVSATVPLEYEKKAERVLMWGHVLTAAPLADTVYDVACGGGTNPFDLIGGVQYSNVFTRSASSYRVKVELAPTEELINKIHAVNTGITCNSYVKTDITVFPYRDVWYDLLGVFSDGFQYQSQIETTVNECAKDYLVTVTVQGNYTEQVFQCYINVNFT